MPCFYPRKGYKSANLTKNGKRKIVFSPVDGYTDLPISVPCGGCIGCRLEKARQWALRIKHEASLHESNLFVTLTYDNEHLPPDFGLCKEDHQKFMKRLRKYLGNRKVRFYHCGEYGEQTLRPHYHDILFGIDFPDKMPISKTKEGQPEYRSEILTNLWGQGLTHIGTVNFQSANYVAQYCMKKITGDQAEAHYRRVNPETGEEHNVLPEYATMSRRPGIGLDWLKKHKDDIYPADYVIHNGRKMKPPKYYDTKIGDEIDDIKRTRKRKAANNPDNTPERLAVREKCAQAKYKPNTRDKI